MLFNCCFRFSAVSPPSRRARGSGALLAKAVLFSTLLVSSQPCPAPAELISRNAPADYTAADRTAILAGIKEIDGPGAPGGVTSFGPAAFAVISGKDGDALSPVVAATRFEKGRVAAFGHNGYLDAFDHEETGALLINAARWSATAPDGKAKQKLRAAVLNQPKLAAWLDSRGFNTEPLSGNAWTRQIAGADVLFCDAHDLRSGREGGLDDIARFVKSGGGLVIAATGWGWESTSKGKSLTTDFPANQLLAPMGLVFNNTTPEKTSDAGFLAATGPGTPFTDASHALDKFLQKSNKPDPAQQLQITATLGLAIRSVPPTDTLFRGRL
ncbi:MAG: hypothetical protein JWL81_924, partial [Verrucomicrobiales bacterium]|nr:hypothetical protein [Verrucomicrobiales bacterium]